MGAEGSEGEEDCHTDCTGGGGSQEQVSFDCYAFAWLIGQALHLVVFQLLVGWPQVAAGDFWPQLW